MTLKILLVSDLHRGFLTDKQLRKFFEKTKEEAGHIDVVINAGDDGGHLSGGKDKAFMNRLMRRTFPDKYIISLMGNHDWWCNGDKHGFGGRPTVHDHFSNLKVIKKSISQTGVLMPDVEEAYHLFKVEGALYFIVAVGGWYSHPNPPTNDLKHVAATHEELRQIAHNKLQAQLEDLDDTRKFYPDLKVIFASHFPVIKAGAGDWKGRFEDFSWSEGIGELMQETYGCKHFLCGHSHQLHAGPLRFEAGSDYGKPKYQIVTVE